MIQTSVRLMWLTLPPGVDRTLTPPQLRIAALLAPGVTVGADGVPAPGQAALADIPDLVDWPSTLASLRFTVEVATPRNCRTTRCGTRSTGP